MEAWNGCNFAAVAKRYTDEAAAWEYLEELRWHDKPVCPHCQSLNVRYFPPKAPRTTPRRASPATAVSGAAKTASANSRRLSGPFLRGRRSPSASGSWRSTCSVPERTELVP